MSNAIVPLSILGAAVTACHNDRLTGDLSNREIRRVLELGSPVVVAEELRRMAALLDETDDARKLIARANELDSDGNYREG